MGIVVQKFGGTSVADAKSCALVVSRIVEARRAGNDVVAVVSAMGRKPAPYSTDALLALAESAGDSLSLREKDAIAACGEIISSVALVSALTAAGCPAMSFTGAQAGIETDDNFGNARIVRIDPARLLHSMGEGKVPVVAGFQGITDAGDVTTLGRGGSDTTAAALAAALGADMIEIYTDVEGIMTADPHIVPDARFQETMSYSELIEMANLGAKVVHLRAVEIASQARIPLAIKSVFSDCPGTLVTDVAPERMPIAVPDRFVSSVTCIGNMAQIVLEESGFDADEAALNVFSTMARDRISVDMINVFPDRIAFIVPARDSGRAVRALDKLSLSAVANPGCAKVSVVGEGMRGVPGVMSRVVRALHTSGIRILQTSDSHYSISCLVPEADMERAACALHSEFELGK
ncbi:MAG: aspartate kinase [Bacillota bacterium]|mgnify:FL=1|jgi:aspartate kinase|nr:aspartate kinase [Bacillota bacterium]HAN86070.1 aspartate kinase [Bacillota bacterium]